MILVPERHRPISAAAIRSVLVSLLATVLAAVLLKLIGSEVRVLGFMQNYIYACALAGLAFGLFEAGAGRARRGPQSFLGALVLLLVVLAACHFTEGRDLGLLRDGSTYFIHPHYLENYPQHEALVGLLQFTVYSLVVYLMAYLGRLLGSSFLPLMPRQCWSVFCLGTLAGWLAIALLSEAGLPPAILLGLLASALLTLVSWSRLRLALLVLVLLLSLSLETFSEPEFVMSERARHPQYFANFWTPYYHVQTTPFFDARAVEGFVITANHNLFQVACRPPRDPGRDTPPLDLADPLSGISEAYYGMPYTLVERPARVLILGGGAGTEAQAALEHGAGHVDCVDSHDWLFRLGERHPQKPFADRRVARIVMEPRQFLRSTKQKYDLIIFAALEGQTAFSPFAPIRTDSFTYTIEAFLDARDRLEPQGFMCVSYTPLRQWYVRRLANNIQLAFGSIDAFVRTHFRGYIIASIEQNRLLSGELMQRMNPLRVGNVEQLMKEAEDVPPTIDNWPFLHIPVPTIPRSYVFSMTILMAAVFVQLRPLIARGGGAEAEAVRLFALACAFTLAVGKAVITLGYNFGLTWDVSVFSAAAAFAAALVAGFCRLPVRVGALVWLFPPAGYLADYSVNYTGAQYIQSDLLKWAVLSVVPLMPVFGVATVLAGAAGRAQNAAAGFGYVLAGMASGCLLSQICYLTQISHLDVVGVIICSIALLSGRARPRAEGQGD